MIYDKNAAIAPKMKMLKLVVNDSLVENNKDVWKQRKLTRTQKIMFVGIFLWQLLIIWRRKIELVANFEKEI
jgi:hypothetical protein